MKKSIFLSLFFLTALEGFAQLSENVGIGIRLRIDSTRGYKTPVIIGLVPNGAAQEAGLQEGDIIQKVNEQRTRDVAQEKVVAMIVGEAGTQVKLSIERNGTIRNYTITRSKYKYAASFYQTAVKDNDFCSALVKLMNDAPYDFKNTADTTHYTREPGNFGRTNYESKVKIPGVVKVFMQSSFGMSGIITIGTYKTKDALNVAGTVVIEQIKNCFPDYYFNPVVSEKGDVSVEIGKIYKDGFESAILQMFYAYSEPKQVYTLTLRVNGGDPTRYYTISTSAQDNSFAKSLRTIYNDILNNFNNVKGTRHETAGGLFSSGSSWYEIVPKPNGAHDCTLTEGGMSLSHGCQCRFYSGENHDEAVEAFKQLYDVMYDALGSEFIFSFEKPKLDMTIPENTESIVVFGIKKKRTYESLPLLTLVLVKESETRYAVNMLFHKFGF